MNNELKKYIRYLQLDPHNPQLLYQVADLEIQVGNYQQAITYLTRLLEMDNSFHSANALLGTALLHSGEIDAALAAYARAKDNGMNDVALQYNSCYALMLKQEYSEAEQGLQALLEQTDRLVEAGPLYIRCLHFQGKVEEAIAFIEQRITQQPDERYRYTMLPTLYLDDEEAELAAESANAILLQYPDDADANTVLGWLAIEEDSVQQGMNYLNHALRYKKNSGRIYAGLSFGALLQGEFEQAEVLMEQAVELMPQQVEAKQILAWCYLLTNKIELAQQIIITLLVQESHQDADSRAESYGMLAVVYIMQHKRAEAAIAIEQARQQDAESLSAQYAQGLLLYLTEEQEKAGALYQHLFDSTLSIENKSTQELIAKLIKNTVKNEL